MTTLTSAALLDLSPVIPVVVLDDADRAVPLAKALLAGGIPIIEVTLRTPAALAAIEAVAAHVPDMVVGAGTITSPAHVDKAVAAGARFLVSPGTTDALLDAMADSGMPYLPGVATVSEALRVLERGQQEMKLFPAEASGGRAFLQSLASPLPDARFCPTGGITPDTAPLYRALPNVGCVGGTWLTPAALVAAGDWAQITRLATDSRG
ncbi:bifunctional 4-hydroxy-2-oxoglutarate aldolase/2-dehydro-3-deoxy-phosphogluconate aldolase [Planosporangium sp. 12N6]|uniref:bifunctional 4-hydroxy-2-oxoglutarate aldolase/2-dehydro-3-deoxy-phosphogluconate aldolase n=1 Tax=Planosporangium spinosum TaxID=3402278 RepID=UPI003CEDB1DF